MTRPDVSQSEDWVPDDPPLVALVSLGCSKNTVDTELALGNLLENGFALCTTPNDADVIIINTCAFIEAARQEAYEVIEEMLACKNGNGTPLVIAMGCLSERSGTALAERYPLLDGVFGLGAQELIANRCRELLAADRDIPPRVDGQTFQQGRTPPEGPRLLITPPSYAYLRIADGCDNRCTYCAIPLIRGPMRSRPREAILDEAKTLQSTGTQELILVAQDTTRFGLDTGDTGGLIALLRDLLATTDVPRIRLMYAHPAHVQEDLLRMLGDEPRLCGYLDLPIQHIDDGILTAMNRHYTRERIETTLDWRARFAPDLVMRTSLIAGFPGESEDAFAQLLAFVREGHFQHLGVFPYSQEPDTPAATLPNPVAPGYAEERSDALMRQQQSITFDWLDSTLGTTTEVLIDQQFDADLLLGRSRTEAPDVDGVIYIKGGKIHLGQRIQACLQHRDGYDRHGKYITS